LNKTCENKNVPNKKKLAKFKKLLKSCVGWSCQPEAAMSTCATLESTRDRHLPFSEATMPYLYPEFPSAVVAELSEACVRAHGANHPLKQFIADLLVEGIASFKDGKVKKYLEGSFLSHYRRTSSGDAVSLTVTVKVISDLNGLNAYFTYRSRNRRARECILQAAIERGALSPFNQDSQ
jgi:hypothetical protein